MAVLRELVSRFTFETDKKSVKQYESTIAGMKKQALKLGAVLGLSVGGKALFNLGVSAEQAEATFNRLADTNVDKFSNQILLLNKRVQFVNKNVAGITTKTGQVLASGFIKTFGNSNKELKIFTQLLESAKIQSELTGESITSIFEGFVNIRKSGGFDPLSGIGKIGLQQTKISEFKTGVADPQDPTGKITRQIRTDELLSQLAAQRKTQEAQLKGFSKELLTKGAAEKKVSETAGQLSKDAFEFGMREFSGIINGFNIGVDKFNNSIDSVVTGFNKAGDIVDSIDKRRSKEPTKSIIINNNINITGSGNSEEIGRSVKKHINLILNDERAQIIGNEDK